MAEDSSQPISAPTPVASAPAGEANPTAAAAISPATDGAITTPSPEPTTPPNTPPAGAAEGSAGAEAGLEVGETQPHGKRKSREDYMRKLKEAEAQAASQQQAEAAVETPAAPAAITVPTPAPVQTPPATVETSPVVDDDSGVQPPGQLPKHFKLPVNGDQLAFETMRLFKLRQQTGSPVTLGEADALARQNLGMAPLATASQPAAQPPDETPAASEPAAPSTPAEPQTLEEVDAAIKALRVEKKKENTNFNFERDDEFDEKIDALLDQRSTLKQSVAQQAQTAEQQAREQFTRTWNENSATAVQLFGADVQNPLSALSQKAAALQTELRDKGDPLYHDPRSILLIYTQAAKALGIQPSAVAAAPVIPPTSKPATTPSAPTAASLISGGNPAGASSAPSQPAGGQWTPSKGRGDYNRRMAALTGR